MRSNNHEAEPEFLSDQPEIPEIERTQSPAPASGHNAFIGFAAGICSGWTKLIVGHPFDTIKTRLQCAPPGTFKGAWPCLVETVSKEGPRALYKGASVPAISWGITDSILMGSLHNYRNWLKKAGFSERIPGTTGIGPDERRLTIIGHSIAGLGAGWSNAWVAHPTELIKCKLQLQLIQPEHLPKVYSGPVDVVRQTVGAQGLTGMYRGLGSSFIYRSCMGALFGSFEVFNRWFKSWDGTSWAMSTGTANFIAGGLASNVYWWTALPMDNVKNRIMTDNIKNPRYKGVFDAYRQTWRETYDPTKGFSWNSLARVKNFWRGFVPVVLRAFPTNAAALAVWESVMRWSTSTT
ncbi:mitochondrial carrier domain-containing protein [Papiliotrema laurentii]|uniref:Mitochondrial carrier domain-containing protein n=1 Tax=Papiliotrema laurentii TaxID=5418 RepID=A0AAD9L8F2_PAPLA|nr:mitochondrial carrier domain-containing protein [Papiliotrema laurentii]